MHLDKDRMLNSVKCANVLYRYCHFNALTFVSFKRYLLNREMYNDLSISREKYLRLNISVFTLSMPFRNELIKTSIAASFMLLKEIRNCFGN